MKRSPEASSPLEIRTLDNGLSVLAERRGIGPVVFAGVVYSVGSRDERPGITGISHMLEHMMFKGTERYAKGEIAALVEQNGGDLNAFTSEDVTMYYEVFARDRWTLALDIEAERMANLQIDAEELESERQVILEERAMYLDMPSVELSEELTAAALRESPYRWPVIGWEADIRSATREEILSHYQKWYAPGNAGLVIVGDIDPEEAFRAAEERFGGIAAASPEARSIPREPEGRGTTRVTLEREVELPQLQILIRAPEMHSRDSEALLLLGHVLSGTRTSRLDVALVESRKAGDVYVHYSPKHDPSTMNVFVEGRPEIDLRELEDIVWAELDRLATEDIAPEERDRALTRFEAAQVFANQSPSSRGFTLGWHLAHGDPHYADDLTARIRALEPGLLRDVAGRVFRRDRSAVGTVVPKGNGQAAGGSTARVAEPPALTGHGVFCPRRAYWAAEGEADVKRFALDNGLHVALQVNRTDPGVALSIGFRAGAAFDPKGREGLAGLTADTMERGTEALDFIQFTRRFEDIGSSFNFGTGSELVHARALFLTRHLDSGLNMVADLFAKPGFRSDDLETMRVLRRNDLMARRDHLDDVAEDLFFREVAGEHPYAHQPQGTDAGVEAVTEADVRAYYAEAYRPDLAHLALVGDFDPEEVEALLRDRFGGLPTPGAPRNALPPFTGVGGARTRIATRTDKAQAQILFGGPGWGANDPDRLAGVAMNHILGGSSIRSRLGDEIRDRQGLAYSVFSRHWQRAHGGVFAVQMGTRPENVRKAVDAIRGELQRIAEGVTSAELEDAQSYLTGSFPLRFTTYGALAGDLVRSSFYGWPEDHLRTYVARVRALELADIRRVAERIAGAAHVVAIAGPVDDSLAPLTPQ